MSCSSSTPGLVLLSISGFGHDGPQATRAGYDQIAQWESGLMSLTASGPGDPQKVGVPICDLLAGMNGVAGVLAALLDRERTGRGATVHTSLAGAGMSVHAFQGRAGRSDTRCLHLVATIIRRFLRTACSDA